MLRKNNHNSGGAEISARGISLTRENENRGELIVATETEAFFAFIFDKGAALVRPSDDKVMCLAEADEIAQHATAFAWPGD